MDTILALRDLLHGDPSHNIFLAVLGLVKANPSQEVVDYALGHLDSWKDQDLRRLHVSGFPAIDPSLTLFRSLSMGGNIGPEGARSLAASPYLSNLTHLNLWGNNIGPEGAAALAASPHLKNLTTLILRWNQIGGEGIAALAASPYLKNTKVIW